MRLKLHRIYADQIKSDDFSFEKKSAAKKEKKKRQSTIE